MLECVSRECSRERRSDDRLSYEDTQLSHRSQLSDQRKALSVVKRVEELSERFNTLYDQLLRIEQKVPDSIQENSCKFEDFSFRLEDLRNRMDKLESDQRLSQVLHTLKLPEAPITPTASQPHTPKIDYLERQAQEQSRKLEDVTLTLSELGSKYDVDSQRHSAVQSLKGELAALQEHVSRIRTGPSQEEFAALQEQVSQLLAGPSEKEFAALQERVLQLSVLQQDAEQQEPGQTGLQKDLMYLSQPVDEKASPPDDQEDIHEVGISSFAATHEVGTSSSDTVLEPRRHSRKVLSVAKFEYEWQKSFWDISILIWTEKFGTSCSVACSTCLFCYLLLVGFLVSESSRAVSQVSFDMNSRAEFSFWRRTVAHQADLRNPITGESLARGVCDQRLYVPFASLQLDTVQVLSDYLESHPLIPSVHTGSFMCVLVLLVWGIRLIEEIALTFDLVIALASLPTSHTTFEQDLKSSSVKLASLSKSRFIFSMILQFFRLVVAIVLGWSGSKFLIQETSLTDMLLNAVAMEFILDLDELIFCALLPKKPRFFFRRLETLKYELPQVWAWQRLVYIMIVFSLGVLSKFLFLDPYVIELEKHMEALCGGVDDSSFDFVIAVDSIGIPWAAATKSSATMVATYAEHAVSEAQELGFPHTTMHFDDRTNMGPFMQIGSPHVLETYMREGQDFLYASDWTIINAEEMDNLVGWNEAYVLAGADFGDADGTVYNRYLHFLLGVPWEVKVSCSSVPLSRCYAYGDRAGLVFRKLCPRHCGCDAPTNGTVSSPWAANAEVGLRGCSAWVTTTRSFGEIIGDLPCQDASRSVFIRWLQGMGDVRNADGVRIADLLLASFESGGCAAVVEVSLGGKGVRSRICAESSLPAICPTSCGCDANATSNISKQTRRTEYCPQSCSKLPPVGCHTIHVNHREPTGDAGPYVGFPCIFPFEYKGVTHNKCTTSDWSGPWCAVTKRKGYMHTWGDCPPSC